MQRINRVEGGVINHFAMPGRMDCIYSSYMYDDNDLYVVRDINSGDDYTYHNELYAYSLNGCTFIKYGCKGDLIDDSNKDRLSQTEFESHNPGLIDISSISPTQISHTESDVIPYHRLYTHSYKFNGCKSGYEIGYFLHMMENIGHYIVARTLEHVYGGVAAVGDDGLKPMNSSKISDLLKRRRKVFGKEIILSKPLGSEIFFPCRVDNGSDVGVAISIPHTKVHSLLGKLSKKIIDIQKEFIIYNNLLDFGVVRVKGHSFVGLLKEVKVDIHESFEHDIPDIDVDRDLTHISKYIVTMRAGGANRTRKGTTDSGAAPLIKRCSEIIKKRIIVFK